ncbi:MAG: tRNA threonylcarbamoyladenosine dehydratase [Burkholderiaceae bacterium]|nr:tRNA threonylcarbamoyladenosine dehydratase [Burkholderiaceae bacterium]MDP4969586.1 tRNA threonylcarbamoyladenosine dehydratase [Burkholderiaceae bacterium]MDP5112241.1 tRNA threonylcarbamoyladenosine dehydratase [Burkholderiaceae bacterium]
MQGVQAEVQSNVHGDDVSEAERRFGGLARLFGLEAYAALRQAHVAIVGIGGVGSWAAEALARHGIGALTLIDLDHIAESNINRQVHALSETLGQSKVAAMAARVLGINPNCQVILVDDFLTPDNVSEILPVALDVVIDCTDQMSAKVAMVLQARARSQTLIVCGGAGGKTNVLALRAGDLSEATHDALLARLRNILRKQHGFARASTQAGKPRKRIPKMGVRVLWLDQPTILPEAWQEAPQVTPDAALQGLSCAGYGSSVTVTASMGLVAAAEAVNKIIGKQSK